MTFARPGLSALFDYTWPCDILAVLRLDGLGRSLRELLETVEILKAQEIDQIGFDEDIDTASCRYGPGPAGTRGQGNVRGQGRKIPRNRKTNRIRIKNVDRCVE